MKVRRSMLSATFGREANTGIVTKSKALFPQRLRSQSAIAFGSNVTRADPKNWEYDSSWRAYK